MCCLTQQNCITVSEDSQQQQKRQQNQQRKSIAATVNSNITRDTDSFISTNSGTSSSSDDDEEEHQSFTPVGEEEDDDDYDPPTTSTTLNDSLFNEISLQDAADKKQEQEVQKPEVQKPEEEKEGPMQGVAITTDDTIIPPMTTTTTTTTPIIEKEPISTTISSQPVTTQVVTTTKISTLETVPEKAPLLTTNKQPQPPKPEPINTSKSGLFGLWSTIKSAGRRPSDPQQDTPLVVEHRTGLSSEERQKRVLQRRSVSQPMLGQENAILRQMEQLNVENTNDPKVRMLTNMKRKSIRQSLVNQNKNVRDNFDWGKKQKKDANIYV